MWFIPLIFLLLATCYSAQSGVEAVTHLCFCLIVLTVLQSNVHSLPVNQKHLSSYFSFSVSVGSLFLPSQVVWSETQFHQFRTGSSFLDTKMMSLFHNEKLKALKTDKMMCLHPCRITRLSLILLSSWTLSQRDCVSSDPELGRDTHTQSAEVKFSICFVFLLFSMIQSMF